MNFFEECEMGFLPKNKDRIIHIVLIAISIYLAFGFAYYLISYYSESNSDLPTDPEKLGQLGDYIGGLLNPTIAGLALLWLIYSVSLQIKELRKTNEALEATLQTAKDQQKQVSIQNFESLFFQLLRTKDDALNDIIHSKSVIKKSDPKKSPLPESAIEKCKSVDAIKMHIIDFKSNTTQDWLAYYEKNMLDFTGSYFRICYQIVKLIDQNESLKAARPLSSNNKNQYSPEQKKYFDIFRATLTKHETEAFFFNCLNEYGNKKFKKLIEKYGLFEPLPIDLNQTGEQIHRLTRYAYQFDQNIFEKNTAWNNYYSDLKEIKINTNTTEMIDLFQKLLDLEIINFSPLFTTVLVVKNNPLLSGTSYNFNLFENYQDVSNFISDTNISRIEDSLNSKFYKSKQSELKSKSEINYYEIQKNKIEEFYKLSNQPIDKRELHLIDKHSKEYLSIGKIDEYIQEENKNLTTSAEYFSNYLNDKRAIQNSEYTLTALLLIKYGIDYIDYCNYLSEQQKNSVPE